MLIKMLLSHFVVSYCPAALHCKSLHDDTSKQILRPLRSSKRHQRLKLFATDGY